MTIEELLGNPVEKIEKMSDDELLKYFEPYLKVTRPELAEKPVVGKHVRKMSEDPSSTARRKSKFDMLNSMAKDLGIELDL